MSDTSVIMEGLAIINQISLEEIDTRIDWLEKALAAYKTLRAVKMVSDSKPEKLDLPDSWVSAVDMDKETINTDKEEDRKTRPKRIPYSWYDKEISKLLLETPGMRLCHIAEKLNLSQSALTSYLNARSIYYYKENRLWYLRNGALFALEKESA